LIIPNHSRLGVIYPKNSLECPPAGQDSRARRAAWLKPHMPYQGCRFITLRQLLSAFLLGILKTIKINKIKTFKLCAITQSVSHLKFFESSDE
jgi:hypothetical protein